MEYEDEVAEACDKMMTKLDGCEKDLALISKKVDQIVNSSIIDASEQNDLQKQSIGFKQTLHRLRKSTLENMDHSQSVDEEVLEALTSLELPATMMPMLTNISLQDVQEMLKGQEELEEQFSGLKNRVKSSGHSLVYTLAGALQERRAHIESTRVVSPV